MKVTEFQDPLDAAISRSLRATEADGSRVLAALAARPLPRQRHGWWAWPMPLRNADFAPAWPRVAALGGIAALGFAVGLVGLDLGGSPISASATIAQADAGLSVVALESEPLTGMRP
jgi:hypothetical protein